ncbi:MAG: anti-sigma factor antagonist [Ruminococcus sp.]|nr:anti-sigma factor antagonist [Ruminococcus sp.]
MEIKHEGRVMTVMLTGELDHHTCSKIRQKIDSCAESERPALLCLDFSGVQFMDSSGVGLVMGRYRQMSLIGGRVQVVNVPDNMERMFVMSGLPALGVMK